MRFCRSPSRYMSLSDGRSTISSSMPPAFSQGWADDASAVEKLAVADAQIARAHHFADRFRSGRQVPVYGWIGGRHVVQARTAAASLRTLSGSLRPGVVSTPVITSSQGGRTWESSAGAFSGVSPPARMTGRGEAACTHR